MDAYKTETVDRHGERYLVEWFFDYDGGPPWEESEGHGIVSEWTRRDKRPGELVLATDRGMHRFYDYAASVRKARAEGWNIEPYQWPSKGAQAAAAALGDFQYLRGWCNDEWHYCGIRVTLLDDDGEKSPAFESLWGIESHADEYHAEVVASLADECRAAVLSRVYPVNHCGV